MKVVKHYVKNYKPLYNFHVDNSPWLSEDIHLGLFFETQNVGHGR